MNPILLVPAAIVALPAVIMAWNVVEVRRWPRVSGVVLSTGLRAMRGTRSAARSFRPVVHYRYSVAGVEYRSSVLTHGMEVGGYKRWAERILERYPPGHSIIVMHHPTAPDKACIEASFGFFGWVLAILASLLLLLALAP